MDRSDRFLGHATDFAHAYPDLEDVQLESFEKGRGIPGGMFFGEHKYGPPVSLGSGGGLIPCSNDGCHRGGFELEPIIGDMLARKLVSRVGMLVCPGDEGSPQGRRVGRRCGNILHYRMTLRYKSERAPARVTLAGRLSISEFSGCPSCETPLLATDDSQQTWKCGQHVYERLPDGRLRLTERQPGAHWYPKIGDVIEAGPKVAVQCLKFQAADLGSLNDCVENRHAVDLCLRDNVPVLVETEEGLRQLTRDGDTVHLVPLSPDDLARCF
jgi:hypothetical protein